MSSDYVGAVWDFDAKLILAIINPEDDSELDNPRWLLFWPGRTAALQMVKIPRAQYMGLMSHNEVIALCDRLKR